MQDISRLAITILFFTSLMSQAAFGCAFNCNKQSEIPEKPIAYLIPDTANLAGEYCRALLPQQAIMFQTPIDETRLNEVQNIGRDEDFWEFSVNERLYVKTGMFFQYPTLTNARDLKSDLQAIGSSKFATKLPKKSTERLMLTDFLLLFTYSVIALDEAGRLTLDEKKEFAGQIKSRMALTNLQKSHTFKGSECNKKFLGEKKFDVFSCQNHAYGKQHLRMLVGVLTNNKEEIEQGRKLYKFAIDDLGSSGALWREASRGAYSWTYYPHALGALSAIGEIDKQLGGDLLSYKNKKQQSLHDAVKFYIDSLKDPKNKTLMWKYALKNVGIDSDRKYGNNPETLARRGRALSRLFYHEWFPIYAHNFPDHPNRTAFKNLISEAKFPTGTYHLGLFTWCLYPQ